MSINFILIFSLTVFLASIIPGPSMLLALTHGMQYGIKRTVATALGNVVVTIIQASISIAGLGAILMASSSIFLAIKWLGVVYLLHIGINMLRNANKNMDLKNVGTSENKSNLRLFSQGMFVTAGNPKAILFFTAILPQFVNIESTFIYQSVLLLVIITFIAFSCFMIYAAFGTQVTSFFSSSKKTKYFKSALGVTFIGMGLGLTRS